MTTDAGRALTVLGAGYHHRGCEANGPEDTAYCSCGLVAKVKAVQAEAAQRAGEELLARLLPYARHLDQCAFSQDLSRADTWALLKAAERGQCDCGFDGAIESAERKPR